MNANNTSERSPLVELQPESESDALTADPSPFPEYQVPHRPQTPPLPGPASAPPVLQSTPISAKSAANRSFLSSVPPRSEILHKAAQQGYGRFVGPMPLGNFVDCFLQLDTMTEPSMPSVREGIFDGVLLGEKACKIEAKMCDTIISGIREFVTSFDIINVSFTADPSCNELHPDIAIYPTGCHNPDHTTNFAAMDFFIEVKRSKQCDPFSSVSEPTNDTGGRRSFCLTSQKAEKALGQLVLYANAQWSRQFRTRIFTVLICAREARFIIWDRSAAIVTESLDYVEKPHEFIKILWLYSKLSMEMRGYDSTVTKPNLSEIASARKALHVTGNSEFIKVTIPQTNQQDAYYIAECPAYISQSPFGKGTRGFVAYSLYSDSVVWVKDYWRIDAPGMLKEGDIYAELHHHKVPHIPIFERGGDIVCNSLCSTSNHLKKEAEWALWMPHVATLMYYRMALGEVGRSLISFSSSYQFVNAVADAIKAHETAYQAGILHRDISAGNILIDAQGTHGYLIDWEFCKKVPHANLASAPQDPPDVPAPLDGALNVRMQNTRTGTWQFISARLLMEPGTAHDYIDDLESFFWVIAWVALRYTHSNQQPDHLSNILGAFDQVFMSTSSGGLAKRDLLANKAIADKVQFDNQKLNAIFKSLNDVFAARYCPPTQENVDVYDNCLAELGPAYPLIRFSGVYHYRENMQRLQNSEFFLNTLRTLLAGVEEWPEADKAKLQQLSSYNTKTKRANDNAVIESLCPLQTKKFKSFNSFAVVPVHDLT